MRSVILVAALGIVLLAGADASAQTYSVSGKGTEVCINDPTPSKISTKTNPMWIDLFQNVMTIADNPNFDNSIAIPYKLHVDGKGVVRLQAHDIFIFPNGPGPVAVNLVGKMKNGVVTKWKGTYIQDNVFFIDCMSSGKVRAKLFP